MVRIGIPSSVGTSLGGTVAMVHWGSYLRGWLLENFGRREAALAAYRDALALAPSFTRARNRLAFTLAALERHGEAVPLFEAVLREDPDNAVAHFNLGFLLDKAGRHEEAVARFREAVRLRPKIDRAWYGLGHALAALGRHGEAAEALRNAADLQPMNPHAWYALGMAYYANGEPARLKEVAMHLVRFDPKMTRRLIQDSGSQEKLGHLVRGLER